MNTTSWLRNSVFGGLLLVTALTPFIVSSTLFFPYITGKGFFFRILIELLFVLWIILVARDTKFLPRKTPLLYGVAAFIGVLILSTIFSVNPARSFWSNFERMEGLISYLHLFGYFIMLLSVAGTGEPGERNRRWNIFFATTIVASLCMALYGAAQISNPSLISSQSGARVDGRFGNAIYMAVYLLIHIFLIIYFAVRRARVDWLAWLLGAAAVLEFFVLYRTQTRSAFYGTLLGVLTALCIVGIQKKGKWRTAVFGGAAGIVLIVGGLYLMRGTQLVQSNQALSRVLNVSLQERTVRSRTTIWSMSIEGVKERPLLGYGLDNFNLIFNTHFRPELFDQENWFDRAHSVFFDWLAAAGIFGLLSYLSLFILAFRVIWLRSTLKPEERAVLTGLLVGYFAHNFVVFDNLLSSILFFALLAYLASNETDVNPTEQSSAMLKNAEERPVTVRYALGAVAVILMIPASYSMTVKPYIAGKTLIQAITPWGQISKNPADFEKNIQYFRQVFALNTFADTEAREQLVQFALRVGGMNEVPQSTREALLVLAADQMRQQVAETPNDARYRLFLGMFYQAVGQHDAAIAELERAVALTPRKQAMRVDLANAYILKGDHGKAVSILEEAYALNTNNHHAAIALAAGYVYAKQDAKADQFIKEMGQKFGAGVTVDDSLVRAYKSRDMKSKIIAILEERVRLNPTDLTALQNLASAHLQAGNRTRAIEVLRAAVAAHPSFRNQGEYYISEIQAGRNP